MGTNVIQGDGNSVWSRSYQIACFRQTSYISATRDISHPKLQHGISKVANNHVSYNPLLLWRSMRSFQGLVGARKKRYLFENATTSLSMIYYNFYCYDQIDPWSSSCIVVDNAIITSMDSWLCILPISVHGSCISPLFPFATQSFSYLTYDRSPFYLQHLDPHPSLYSSFLFHSILWLFNLIPHRNCRLNVSQWTWAPCSEAHLASY